MLHDRSMAFLNFLPRGLDLIGKRLPYLSCLASITTRLNRLKLPCGGLPQEVDRFARKLQHLIEGREIIGSGCISPQFVPATQVVLA